RVVRIFAARTGQLLYTLRGPTGLTKAAFSPDGKHIAAAPPVANHGGDGVVRVFDVQTRKEGLAVYARSDHGPLPPPVYSPDGSRIATTFSDGAVRAFDARTGKVAVEFPAPRGHTEVAFSPDGRRLAAGIGVAVRVYDLQTRPGGVAVRRTMGGVSVFDP